MPDPGPSAKRPIPLPRIDRPARPAAPVPDYVDLQVTSNFSFLRSGSHPEELVATAAALGHAGAAITDRNSLAGVVRAHKAAKEVGLRLVVGARLDLDRPDGGSDGSYLTFPEDRAAYGRLSALLSRGRRRAPKGQCWLTRDDFLEALGQAAVRVIALPPDPVTAPFRDRLQADRAVFGDRLSLAAWCRYDGLDRQRLASLAGVSAQTGVPLVATNDIALHSPARRRLLDTITAIRIRETVARAGRELAANAERHLKSPAEMARLFAGYESALARSVAIAEACRFSLDELRYEYPDEVVEPNETPQETLTRLTWEGAAWRYPGGVPETVADQLRHELGLVAQLGYAPYFLTVHDIVRFARSRGILCQGRGSAANSAVCYALGITAVDPARADLLFERFVSAERGEPPDIDVDFEHDRREEVIQYIYEKYGRDRAGLAVTVICYRGRGAVREVGRAMGLSEDTINRLSGSIWGWSTDGVEAERLIELGLDPEDETLRLVLELSTALSGFPRHLSQHVGGFVISRGPLVELVPVENAAMADRTVIQWDKDDLEALGLLKVDVLALGMLSCVQRAFDLLDRHYGRHLTLATVPAEDPAVYDMLCRADSLGVFQVESRAQMTMLPRLRPREFYDLVVEVAIVRPGPIQGDMVHPYLRRRNGEEAVEYPSEDLRAVLEKTLGVPLFQEQAMKIAIVAAGFTPAEADRLRRAMATFKKSGEIHSFYDKMINGMIARGYDPEFSERCFKQIEGFGTYGFPESHAASFALLVYVSAWLKCHYPEVFACALLNSQPMGFYAPAQIVRDAREHGVRVLPPDVNVSGWDSTLEPVPPSEAEGSEGGGDDRPALRLGLRLIKGAREEDATAILAARAEGGRFTDMRDLWLRSGLPPARLEVLAKADAMRGLGLDRRQAVWALKPLGEAALPLFAQAERTGGTLRPADRRREAADAGRLPNMPLGEHVVQDYAALSLTLKAHPLALLRAGMEAAGWRPVAELYLAKDGQRIAVAGLTLVRQRPGSAKGVIFITIEDETGVGNLVILPPVFEAYRRPVIAARLVGAVGRVERHHDVVHLKVDRLVDMTGALDHLLEGAPPPTHGDSGRSSRAFWGHLARADEVVRPTPDARDGKPCPATIAPDRAADRPAGTVIPPARSFR